ncbi:MAG: hypothetical protein GOVbin4933_54 [Prokaryotic dsDNA virus sp.]|nr:MAG: hypothetical protein GOVbin4933_54 [Prokaryotic dsDNA virus sp.]|tara:strand:+ start:6193 stop:7251 length:1059 start_codon:yes stop_codon:yes gene_type:complete
MTTIAAPLEMNGVFYQDVYYQPTSKGIGADSKGLYEIKDPPNTGWSRALVIWPDDNEPEPTSKRKKKAAKRVTVFCPYTMSAYQIRFSAREVAQQRAYPLTPELIDKLEAIINRNWKMYAGFGFQKAYDVAALVLTRLGKPVPNYMRPADENLEYTETSVPNRRGKPVAEKLLRPVNASSKRGQVCAFFLEDRTGSIREAMAKFDMTRSGVLTHLHGLHKDHGLGYVLQGDMATLMLPEGCESPLLEAAAAVAHQTASSAKKAGKECKPTVTALPAKGKRREVALTLVEEAALADVAEKVGCTVNSVRSHLHDLHTKHGFGYELSPDKSRGKLITPEGWTSDYDPDELDPLA